MTITTRMHREDPHASLKLNAAAILTMKTTRYRTYSRCGVLRRSAEVSTRTVGAGFLELLASRLKPRLRGARAARDDGRRRSR